MTPEMVNGFNVIASRQVGQAEWVLVCDRWQGPAATRSVHDRYVTWRVGVAGDIVSAHGGYYTPSAMDALVDMEER